MRKEPWRKGYWDEGDSQAAIALKQVLQEIFLDHRLLIKEAAARLNISTERLQKYLNENAGHNNFPAYLVPIFTKMIGPELLSYLAHEAGYAIVKLPEPGERPELRGVVKAATRAMRECAEALEAFGKAIEDGTVTPEELREVKREVREAVEALLTLQYLAERMRK